MCLLLFVCFAKNKRALNTFQSLIGMCFNSLFFLAILEKGFATFSCPEIAPVARLKDDVTILELFHGRTWAFKDIALSCVGQFLNYFCSRNKTHYTVVVGKS